MTKAQYTQVCENYMKGNIIVELFACLTVLAQDNGVNVNDVKETVSMDSTFWADEIVNEILEDVPATPAKIDNSAEIAKVKAAYAEAEKKYNELQAKQYKKNTNKISFGGELEGTTKSISAINEAKRARNLKYYAECMKDAKRRLAELGA